MTTSCPGCHGAGTEPSGTTHAGLAEHLACGECGPGCPPDCGCRVDAEPECPESVAQDGLGADSRLCRLLADKAALLGDVDRLTAERDRARGTAVALEAENARLTEALYLTRITLEATFRVLQEASGLPDDIDDPDCRDEMVLALRPRAEKAEAENARLREGIERLASMLDTPAHRRPPKAPRFLNEAADDLRALLADTDGAKDEGGDRG